MDSNQKECRKLQLSWYTPQFLPISSENQWISTISEQLNPYDFMRPDIEEQYWGVPEILTEMRWVLQRAGKIPCEEHNGYDGDFSSSDKMYTKMLAYFRYIGITLGYKAAQYTEAVNYLGPKEYWLFWKKYDYSLRYLRHKVTKCSKEKRRAFFWKWFDTAGEFLDLPGIEKVSEFKSAVAAAKKLRNMSLDHDQIEGFIHSCSVEEFINRMDESFEVYRWMSSEVSGAKQGLKDVSEWVENTLNNFGENTEFLKVNVLDPEHWETIWVGLQKIADCVCEQIRECHTEFFGNDCKYISLTTRTGLRISKAKDMMKHLHRIVGNLEFKGEYLKHLIEVCGVRCVAVMEYTPNTSNECLITFSGYFDISDKNNRVYALVGNESNYEVTFEKLKDVAKQMGCKFLQVTDELAKYIQFIDPTTSKIATLMRDVEKNLDIGTIKGRYSCCERKLLAYIKMKKISPNSIQLYIKKEPCQRCEAVISAWENKICPISKSYVKI